MMSARWLCLGLCLLAGPVYPAGSGAPPYLDDFFADLQTLQAKFEQQVLDSNFRQLQSSSGRMWIKRPGRFRWDYTEPYRQQLVADGERLWSWDEDLEQVTVQPASEVLTATPAMLLSGEQPLAELFTISEVAEQRVLLKPKADDSNVTELRLQFSDGRLDRIAALDTFGNTTLFTFSDIRRNAALDDALFRFEPPAGADVIGDGH